MLAKSKRRNKICIILALAALPILVLACVMPDVSRTMRHRWWAGLGPVLPHDTFPADCKLCHVGDKWDTLVPEFEYDHGAETGVPLTGAHREARCLHCHNDRGPVDVFQSKGCAGCHEDVHRGMLGPSCASCHDERTWRPRDSFVQHSHSRFPLVAAHAGVACWRCHPGGEVGNFTPTDTECATCHRDELARTTNHINLGWVDRCDRCHMPTFWEQAEVR